MQRRMIFEPGGHVPSYNLDLSSPTIYIKRVLRPVCFVALSLAAFSFAAGQAPVSPTTSAAPPPSKAQTTAAPASKPAPVKPLPTTAPSAPAPNSPGTTTDANPAPATNPPPSIPGTTPMPDRMVTLQFPNSDVVDV